MAVPAALTYVPRLPQVPGPPGEGGEVARGVPEPSLQLTGSLRPSRADVDDQSPARRGPEAARGHSALSGRPIGQRPPPRGHTAQTGWAHWPAPPRVTQLTQDGPVCPPPSVTQLTQDGPISQRPPGPHSPLRMGPSASTPRVTQLRQDGPSVPHPASHSSLRTGLSTPHPGVTQHGQDGSIQPPALAPLL